MSPSSAPSWRTIELRPLEQITIVRWSDPVVDAIGLPIDGTYAEKYWLPVLGPTATWMARRLAAALADEPVTIDMATLGATLGVGAGTGANCPLVRALARLCRFGIARDLDDAYKVRAMVGPVPRSQLKRLPTGLQLEHAALMRAQARMAT